MASTPDEPVVTQVRAARPVLSGSGLSVSPVAGDRCAGPAESSSLAEAFLRSVRAFAGRPVLVTPEGAYTYEWLGRAAAAVRDHLRATTPFRSGDRVGLLLQNSPEYLAAFYGTLLAGGVVVPVPPDTEAERLHQILASSEPVHMLTSPAVVRRRSPLRCAGVHGIELDGDSTPREQPGCWGAAGLLGSDLAALFYTSGSTGEPKGVMLSHGNLLSNAHAIREYLEIGPDDRALALLPFYHAFGNSVLQTHVLSGGALVLDGSLVFPESILDAVREYGATSFSGVPDVFRVLLSRTSLGETELPSLRYAAVAGGRLDPDQALVTAARIAPAKLFVMYGQTEATARLAYLPPEELERRYGSLGRAIPGVELEVVDPLGRPVRPGETGEIRARGPNVMLGYWRDPELTARTLRGGWLDTGDLATVDEDGYIYPQGRRSALVKIGGYRVHPREIEEFIGRHIPAQQIVVVPYEAAEVGTRLALFVQPWPGESAPTAADLRKLCVRELPRHKVPEQIDVLAELPLNDALKIDRRNLARRASEAAKQAAVPAV